MNAPAPKLPEPTGGTPAPQPPAGSPPDPTPPAGNAGATGAAPPAPAAGATGATGEPAKKPTSIYEAAGVDEPGKEGSTTWPANWREQAAEAIGDPKAAKQLERYQTPTDMAKALLAAQAKIRSGEYKRAAPAGDNPEELKAWREEQGIPDSPDGYEIPGVDLEKLEPSAKAAVDLMRTKLHAENFPKGQVATVASLLQEVAALQMEQTAQADAQRMDAIEDSLRAEWGADYRKNINLNGALLNQHFGDEMDSILSARMPDGTRLADHPGFNKFLNTMARATGGDELFTGDVSGGTSIDGRLAEIRQVMNTNINEYYSKGLDKEYAQLLEKQQARAKR